MSTSQPNAPSQQEMDLTDIFSLIGRFFKSIVTFFFRIIDFIIKMWWVILLLVIVGVAVGYFTKSAPSYTANLLLKTNFKSQSYVYTSIGQFNDNLAEGDTEFLSSLGVDPETFSVASVKVNPIVEVIDIISLVGENDRVLGEMTREFKLEDDQELFATDRFLSNYKYHKLEVGLRDENAKDDIAKLLAFINNQPYALELKKKGLQSHKELIERNEKTLEQIDEVIAATVTQAAGAGTTKKEAFFFNNSVSSDPSELLNFKILLARNIEELKNDEVSYTDAAVLVSDIQASKDTSFLDNKIFIYPIILVFAFLGLSAIAGAYRNYRREEDRV